MKNDNCQKGHYREAKDQLHNIRISIGQIQSLVFAALKHKKAGGQRKDNIPNKALFSDRFTVKLAKAMAIGCVPLRHLICHLSDE